MGDPSAVEGLQPKYRVTGGIETRFYNTGCGDKVVLLHGGPWGGTSSSNTWSLNVETLSQDFEVFAPDRLGCGLTEAPDQIGEFVYENEIEHIEEFVSTMGLDRYHLIGSSRGAGLAGAVTVKNQDSVQSLTILNTGTLGYKLGPDILHRREKIFEDVEKMDLDPKEENRTVSRKYCYQYDHITDEYLEASTYIGQHNRSQQTAEMMTDEVFSRYEETLQRTQRQTQEMMKFGEYDVPTLLYWGRNDPTAIPEQGWILYDMISHGNPETTMTMINKCGHLPHREHAERFNEDVRHFIETTT